MARTNSPEVHFSHGYTLEAVKVWRARENEAGRPSGLDDFFRVHHLCVDYGGNGKFAIGVRWRDKDGIERTEEGLWRSSSSSMNWTIRRCGLATREKGITCTSHAKLVGALVQKPEQNKPTVEISAIALIDFLGTVVRMEG